MAPLALIRGYIALLLHLVHLMGVLCGRCELVKHRTLYLVLFYDFLQLSRPIHLVVLLENPGPVVLIL